MYNAYINSEVKANVGEEALFTLLDRAAKETGDEGYIKQKGEYMVKTPSFNLNPDYFSNGHCSYSYSYGNGSKTTSTGNYQIVGCNPSGTIATLSVFNMTGYSLPSTLNINCEPLGDNMISINSMGYTYSP